MTEKRKIDRLIFVYNANSGTLNAIFESTRKLLRLNGCDLCQITHGLAGESSDWRNCKEELGVPVDYLHKDELDARMEEAVAGQLPAVVAEAEGHLVLLLNADAVNRCRGSVSDLKGRLLTHAAMRGLELPV